MATLDEQYEELERLMDACERWFEVNVPHGKAMTPLSDDWDLYWGHLGATRALYVAKRAPAGQEIAAGQQSKVHVRHAPTGRKAEALAALPKLYEALQRSERERAITVPRAIASAKVFLELVGVELAAPPERRRPRPPPPDPWSAEDFALQTMGGGQAKSRKE